MNRLIRLGAVGALVLPLIGAFGAAPALAATCQPGTPAPSGPYPGTAVVANNFESGNLAGFTVTTGGAGTATVDSPLAHSGSCAAHLHSTADAGSVANISAPLPVGTADVYADAWFNVTKAGAAGSNVAYLRLFSGSARIADVYRDNGSGQPWLRTTLPSGSTVSTRLLSTSIPLNTWHRVVIHMALNGAASTVEVWIDGVKVYTSNQVSTGATALSAVQLGSESRRQVADTFIDDLVVHAPTEAPPPPSETCQSATPAPTNSQPGTTAAATNFESNTLAPLIPTTAGTGTATVSTVLSHSGACAAYLHATTDSGSLAYLSAPLPAGSPSASADGWFNITQAGVDGNNVPYFRFFSGSTRVADIYRYNNNGQLWLRVTSPSGSFVFTKLISASIPLSSWHHVEMRVVPNGAATSIQVWFDGTSVYSSNTVNTAATSLSRVQLGAEHTRQMGDTYIDDVIVKSGS